MNFKNNTTKKYSKLTKILKTPLFYSSILLGVTLVLFANENLAKTNQKPSEYETKMNNIQNNIKGVYGYSSFNTYSFSGEKIDNKYYFKLIGLSKKLEIENNTKISILGYQIDQNMYTILTKSNSYEDILYVLNIMEIITKQKADIFYEQINGFPPSVTLSANNSVIESITAPQINKTNKTISFSIGVLEDKETNNQNEFMIEKYLVSAPLTKELLENPNLIYEQYMTGKTNFKLIGQEVLKINNKDASDNSFIY